MGVIICFFSCDCMNNNGIISCHSWKNDIIYLMSVADDKSEEDVVLHEEGRSSRIFIYLTKDGEAEVVWRVPSRSYSPGTAVVLAICVLMFTTVVSFRLLVSCLLHESSFRYH